jgi:hypothetical protein
MELLPRLRGCHRCGRLHAREPRSETVEIPNVMANEAPQARDRGASAGSKAANNLQKLRASSRAHYELPTQYCQGGQPMPAKPVPASIPGYALGSAAVPRSPVSVADFELLKKTVLMTDEDLKYLRISRDVLEDQVEAVLDVW